MYNRVNSRRQLISLTSHLLSFLRLYKILLVIPVSLIRDYRNRTLQQHGRIKIQHSCNRSPHNHPRRLHPHQLRRLQCHLDLPAPVQHTVSFFIHIFSSQTLYVFIVLGGISGRPKYVADPSVQSNAYGGMRTSFSNTLPGLPNPMQPPAPVPPVPMMSGNPSFPSNTQSTPYGNLPPLVPTQNPLPPGPLTPSSFPQPSSFNTNPIQSQPMPGSTPLPNPPPSMYNPGNVEVAQPAVNAFHPPIAPPGWNDPPMISKSSRQQVKVFLVFEILLITYRCHLNIK